MTRASKLLPPRRPATFLERPSLAQRLDRARDYRLTTVVAGAGFGKSTLLGPWLSDLQGCWYTIDETDESPATLARGLVDSLRVKVPDLFTDLDAALQGSFGADEGAESQVEALAGQVGGALEEVDDLVLVLDDLHELSAQTDSAHLIEALCRHAPEHCHIVLSSRAQPPFPIERMRGRGQVLDIDASALAFSQDEVEALLQDLSGHVDGDLARELHALTHGWPAAVRLAAEAFQGSPVDRRRVVLEGLRRPGGSLVAYLAAEVFPRERPSVRELLMRVALFERFTPELCEAVGIANATETVWELAARGLLVRLDSDSGEWFVLHSLVREFVLGHWPLSPEETRTLHVRAAEWFEASSDLDSAIGSLNAAGDRSGITRILEERGDEMLRSGHADRLIWATDLLAGDSRTPTLEQLAGEARQIRGDWTGALACYGRAANRESLLSPGLAWRMGLLHYLRADINEALMVYARGRVEGTAPRDEALLLAWNAAAHWAKGDAEDCRDAVTRASEAAEISGDPQALAAVHTVLAMLASALEGDRREGDRHYRLALDYAERANDVLQLIRIRTNRGSHLDDEGRYEEALAELETATGLAELTGFTYFLGLGLSNRASVRFHLGQVDEAIADNKRAVSVYRELGSLDVGHPLRNLGEIYRARGDLTLARSSYEEAIELAERSGDRQVLTPALAGLARVLAGDEPEEASKLADRAVSLGPGFDHLGSLLAQGWVALARGDREKAAQIAEGAAEFSRGTRDRPRLAELLELQVFASSDPQIKLTRLEEALSIRREIHDELGAAAIELALGRLGEGPDARALAARAERRLTGLGVRMQAPAAGVLACLPRSDVAPVQIRSLGGFAVLRNGRPVPAAEWQSKKARDLLKVLVARRGRPAPRDLLAELLWPEKDPGKLPNRLSVALSIVRAALDPDKLFSPERFIISDKDSVALNLASVSVDVEEFLADADAGLDLERQGRVNEAHELLVAAEATYAGDFLEEDLYEDWSVPLREEARAAYIAVASALARAAVAARDHEAGIPHFLRLLERDPYDEGANLELVSALTSCGRHGEARHHYRAYVSRMTEIEVEAAPFPTPALL